MHQKWLNNLNLNKANYYVENEKLKEILQNQRLIIAKLEKEISTKNTTIRVLTESIDNLEKKHLCNNNNSKIINLLDFD
jgi:hypothetical protein